MSLYSLWLDAHKKGILASEWKLAHNFLTWATANGYKTEFGYEGKFTPDNLRAAILKTPNAKIKATIADAFGLPEHVLNQVPDDAFNEFEKTFKAEPMDAETIKNSMNKESLVALAKEKCIKLVGAETKRQIADMIVAKEGEDAGE